MSSGKYASTPLNCFEQFIEVTTFWTHLVIQHLKQQEEEEKTKFSWTSVLLYRKKRCDTEATWQSVAELLQLRSPQRKNSNPACLGQLGLQQVTCVSVGRMWQQLQRANNLWPRWFSPLLQCDPLCFMPSLLSVSFPTDGEVSDGHPGGTGLSPHTTLHRQSCQPGLAHPPVYFSMLPMLWQERDPQLPVSRLNCWEFKAGVRKGCFITRLVQLDISYLQYLLNLPQISLCVISVTQWRVNPPLYSQDKLKKKKRHSN